MKSLERYSFHFSRRFIDGDMGLESFLSSLPSWLMALNYWDFPGWLRSAIYVCHIQPYKSYHIHLLRHVKIIKLVYI